MTKIKGALRTQKQAYQHVLSELNAGRLGAMKNGSCVYEHKVKKEIRHCGVGCLFTPKQITDIRKWRMNGDNIGRLAVHVGKNNVEAATGLSMEDLRTLQGLHDAAFDQVESDSSDETIELQNSFRQFLKAKIRTS